MTGRGNGVETAPLRTVTVRDFDALIPHIEAWDSLAWNAPQALPSLLPDWADAYFRNSLLAEESWFCSFAYAGDELIGVLPVVVAPHPIMGPANPLLRTLFSDGSTNSGDILLSPEHAAAAFEALLKEIKRQVPGYLGLDLHAIRQNSPVWDALASKSYGHSIIKGHSYFYSRIDLRIGSAAYFATLGNLGRNLRRYRKKLDSRGTVTVEMNVGSTADEDFLSEFLALEASGWKGRNKTAILDIPRELAFYTNLVKSFAARKRLEWHVIRVHDRIVAAEMGIRCGSSLMLPRIAFDEDFAGCMPGNLLTGEVITAAFERRELTELNHLSNADWHKAWRMPHDVYSTIHLVRRNAKAVLLHQPLVAARVTLKEKVKPHIPPTLRRVLKSPWRTLRKLRKQKGFDQAS